MSALRRTASRPGRLVRVLAHAAIAAAVLLPAVGPGPVVAQPTTTAVEYYHAGFNHYFITAYAHEISLLDGGAYGGVWSRTGKTFQVWTGAGPGIAETCRFFSAAFAPRSSHFYTPFAAECEMRKQDPAWTFEAVAFYLQPSPLGTCGAGTVPLYRANNNGMSGAPNHRYTTDRATFDQMRAAGWLAEGNGPQIVFACVPATVVPGSPVGLWEGSVGNGSLLYGIVLPDGTFYVLYSVPNTESIGGVVQGTLTVQGTSVSSVDARDYNFVPFGAVFPATISGTFVSGQSLTGTIAESGASVSFTADWVDDSIAVPSLALTAGTFTGIGATSAGVQATSLTVAAGGAISGSSGGCTFGGTATPRTDLRAFDLSITFNGAPCALGSATIAGIAVYEGEERQLFAVGLNGARTDGFLFVGDK